MILSITFFQKVSNCETRNIFKISVFQEDEVAKLERPDKERSLWTIAEKVFFQHLVFDLIPFESILAMQH